MVKFERIALGLIGGLVAVLMVVTLVQPQKGATAAPRANLSAGLDSGSELAALSIVPAGGLEAAGGLIARSTVGTLSKTFERMGYDLETVFSGAGRVPRVFLASLPADLHQVREAKVRKTIFFQTLLPLVLQINEEILVERERLWELRTDLRLGRKLDAIDRLWLIVMAERYGTQRGDLDALIPRVDIIPPSLALAQGAEESGWGTSRFTREGNAVFGQWTYKSSGGLVPRDRDRGKTHRIRAFRSLLDSVRAYTLNLNTHRAYAGLRRMRAAMRRDGVAIEGYALAASLDRYSERGQEYVDTIRSIISANSLRRLVDARLSDHEDDIAVTGKKNIFHENRKPM